MIAQLVAATRARPDQQFFWATRAGAELDLLPVRGTERFGFEIERTASPRVTPALRSALATLRLDRAFVVHAGPASFPLDGGQMVTATLRLPP